MNIVYTIEVQDGEKTRYEYVTKEIESGLTPDEILVEGEDLVKDLFSYDELTNGFYWDKYMEIAGKLFTYHVIDNSETWRTIKQIIG